MKSDEITVSYIITLYNKEKYIAATARSILEQEGISGAEYIFVDDVSTDRSVEVLEAYTRGMPNVTVVKNTVNAGPSIRLNQGARLARGRYLQFFDSDDIMAANASAVMHSLLVRHRADLIYGQWQRVDEEGPALIGRRIAAEAPALVSDTPLETVLRGHYIRMTLMVRREIFLAAGGADESIFIQDESLPLRLALRASRFVSLQAPVLFVPRLEGNLSGNKSQLNHDRFFANHNLLRDQGEAMSETARRLLYRRCVSAAWKEARRGGYVKSHLSPIFAQYLGTRLRLAPVNRARLERLREYFAALDNVRRVTRA